MAINSGYLRQMPMLKRNPSLTEQVRSYLKQRIVNAEFEAGRIPSEARLASELSVSRNTVRDALSRLEMEGMIFRKQGAGTFVNTANPLIKPLLEEIVPYDRLIRDQGYKPAVVLVGVDEQLVNPKTATELKLGPEEQLLVVQQLFLADEMPVIFTLTHIPSRIVKRPYSHDDFRGPIYEFLPNFCGQELAYYVSEIVPLIAPPRLVDRLQLPDIKTALISFKEIGHNEEHEPIFKAISYFRDDLLRLRLIRRR